MTLFPVIIQSVSFSQKEIIQSICELHIKGNIQADVTYNKGSFWRGLSGPEYKYDIAPQTADTVKADYKNIPVADKFFSSIMFDPPFICSTQIKSTKYVMSERYSSYKNIESLQQDYAGAIEEFGRVIAPAGFLVVKCQDTVSGRKNYFNHILIHDLAVKNNFKPIDLFILVAKNRFTGNVQNQFHSRKYHCYFWVFKKQK